MSYKLARLSLSTCSHSAAVTSLKPQHLLPDLRGTRSSKQSCLLHRRNLLCAPAKALPSKQTFIKTLNKQIQKLQGATHNLRTEKKYPVRCRPAVERVVQPPLQRDRRSSEAASQQRNLRPLARVRRDASAVNPHLNQSTTRGILKKTCGGSSVPKQVHFASDC